MPFIDILDSSRPIVIAHRGASGEAPENTMAAFAMAVEQGAHVVELDVHMSADGYPVVIHDQTLDRTTSGHGMVRETTLAELRKLDAGAWFDRRFAGERVLTLEEVVAWAKDRVALAIEIKNHPIAYRGIEASVVELLERHGAAKEHEVFSFDHPCMKRIKTRQPIILTGVCYVADPVDHVAMATAPGAAALHPMFHYLRPETVRDAHAAGLLIFPWTANNPQDVHHLYALGVDGIVTDFPARVSETLNGKS